MPCKMNVKYILLLATAVVALSLKSFSQDTIYKRNGDILIAQILEITPVLVKFKKIAFLEGPIYSIEKNELFMIRYKNGSKDMFWEDLKTEKDDYAKAAPSAAKKKGFDILADYPISIDGYHYSTSYLNLNPRKIDELLLAKNNKQINSMIKGAQSTKRSSKLLAFAPIPCGVGAYVALIAGSINGTNNYNSSIPPNYLALTGILVAAGIGTGISSIVLNSRSKKMRKEAVEFYNLTYFGSRY